jgi:hypothetical protein
MIASKANVEGLFGKKINLKKKKNLTRVNMLNS